MKITDLQVISFRVPRRPYRNGQFLPETTVIQTLTKIVTDAGAEGYYLGGHGHGDQDGLHPDEIAALTGRFREMLVGQDPFDRERFWHWMWVANLPENLISVVDMALWDLQGRLFGVPVHKLLGGCRDRVKAYASTFPNMGPPEVYAAHALACKAQGYRHYKIHPYYFWDPLTGKPDPGRPSHIEQDIEACRAVRAAVGPEMVLSFDPWGTYRTYEEAVRVGRELEKLGFTWYEHPMNEYRVAAYEKLCRELDDPDLVPGDRGRQHLHPRRLDPPRRLRHEPHRRAARGHHRRQEAGLRLRGVRRQVRDPHERLRQPADPGRDERGHLRVLRARAAGARRGL